jgi:hypothetical protein
MVSPHRRPQDVRSGGALVKAALEEMGISPRLALQPDFPPDVLGFAMAAFYAGRMHLGVRGYPLPAVSLDCAGMYPAVASLAGLWRWVIAREIRVVEIEPQVLQEFLDGLTVPSLFQKETWRHPLFQAIALMRPQGEWLPLRAREEGDTESRFTVAPVSSPHPLWYAAPDLAAAKVLGGRVPAIERVLAFVPSEEVLEGLRPVRLAGTVPFDPRTGDFFRMITEERYRLKDEAERAEQAGESERARRLTFAAHVLKTYANAGCYGIFIEFLQARQGRRSRPALYGPAGCCAREGERKRVLERLRSEVPGAWAFPPLAVLVTAFGRLLFALMERSVRTLGGTILAGDTDGWIVAAGETRTLVSGPAENPHAIQLLSRDDIDELRRRFQQLSPYAPERVPSFVRDEGWFSQALVFRPKVYAALDERGSLADWTYSSLETVLACDVLRQEERRDEVAKAVWEAKFRNEHPVLPSLPIVRRLVLATPQQLDAEQQHCDHSGRAPCAAIWEVTIDGQTYRRPSIPPYYPGWEASTPEDWLKTLPWWRSDGRAYCPLDWDAKAPAVHGRDTLLDAALLLDWQGDRLCGIDAEHRALDSATGAVFPLPLSVRRLALSGKDRQTFEGEVGFAPSRASDAPAISSVSGLSGRLYDTARAAREIGVSRRTVQRWIRDGRNLDILRRYRKREKRGTPAGKALERKACEMIAVMKSWWLQTCFRLSGSTARYWKEEASAGRLPFPPEKVRDVIARIRAWQKEQEKREREEKGGLRCQKST